MPHILWHYIRYRRLSTAMLALWLRRRFIVMANFADGRHHYNVDISQSLPLYSCWYRARRAVVVFDGPFSQYAGLSRHFATAAMHDIKRATASDIDAFAKPAARNMHVVSSVNYDITHYSMLGAARRIFTSPSDREPFGQLDYLCNFISINTIYYGCSFACLVLLQMRRRAEVPISMNYRNKPSSCGIISSANCLDAFSIIYNLRPLIWTYRYHLQNYLSWLAGFLLEFLLWYFTARSRHAYFIL